MIIICPECATKFRISPDRLPAGGGKVRCARCRHIFPVAPPETETDQSAATDTSTGAPAPPPENEESVDTFRTRESQDRSEESTQADDFSYDRFQELDARQEPEEDFSFGDAASATSDTDETPQATSQPFPTDDEFSFSDQGDASLSPYEKVINGTADGSSAEEDSTAYQAPQPAGTQPAEPEFPEQPPAAQRRSPLRTLIRLLLILILILLIVGGILVYLQGPDQLNQSLQQLFGQQDTATQAGGQITLSALEGKFIHNEQAGELFLIRGEAINQYPEPRAAIQVRGIIYDQNSKPLLQKTIYCGNPISETELKTLSFAELEKKMGNQFGKDLSNMKVNSRQAIPFAIVFKDLPENLAEFSVKVADSEAVSK